MSDFKSIKLAGQNINYQLRRRSGMRYVRLSIGVDGNLVVSAPKRYPQFLLKQFIIQKQNWIKQAIARHLTSASIFRQQHSAQEIKQYKLLTKKLVVERLEYFNNFYNLKYKKVTIRKASSRWGSCSKQGNLNFNYRLCLLDPKLLDYVVVHELCHLQEFNHSKAFWELVAKQFPDYKMLKQQLKSLA
jgi:predicted metal-dependent hydrolase